MRRERGGGGGFGELLGWLREGEKEKPLLLSFSFLSSRKEKKKKEKKKTEKENEMSPRLFRQQASRKGMLITSMR